MENQFAEIGFIHRTHGVNGEFQVSWNNDFYFEQQDLESVFLLIEGIPVPFFVESVRSKGEDKAIVKFDEINSIEAAEEFVGLKLLLPENEVEVDDELTLDKLVGYTVTSEADGVIGTITAVEEYSTNTVFELLHTSGKSIMIPAADDFIVEVDEETRTITMEVPEGLIDVYLEE